MPTTPKVLFVCVKNGGKSQMAAALMRHASTTTGTPVEVFSAGTRAGAALNSESVEAVAEVGADMSQEHPKPLDLELLRRVDRVVVLGTDALVQPVDGMAGPIEIWETDEPSLRGIEGAERMRLIRDDIAARVERLLRELTRA